MRFKHRRALAAFALIGAVAAGGAAYTAGSGFGSQPASSYAAAVIQGVQATNLQFQYSQDGSVITEADMLVHGDYSLSSGNQGSPYTIKAGFGTGATGTTLSPALLTSTCTASAYDAINVGTMTGSGDPITVPAGDTGISCPFNQAVSNSIDHGPGVVDPSSGTGANQFNLLVTSTNPTS